MTYKVGMNLSQALKAAKTSKWTGEQERAKKVEQAIRLFFSQDNDGKITDNKELEKFNQMLDNIPYSMTGDPFKRAYQLYKQETQQLEDPETNGFVRVAGKYAAGFKNALLGVMGTIAHPFSDNY